MVELNWLNLRTHDGSQRHGFEELCCQLAFDEPIADKKNFIRFGTQDGGVECCWELSDTSVIGWQAKFFNKSFGPQQWGQITSSIKTMVKKHPLLIKYIICIPINRSGTTSNKKSFMSEWNKYVKKWKKIPSKNNIEFEFWGDTELLNKLSKPHNVGKLHFWFNEKNFTPDWFSKMIDVEIADVGPRYNDELNIPLEISKFFNVLGRTDDYFETVTSYAHDLNVLALKLKKSNSHIGSSIIFIKICSLIDTLTKQLEKKYMIINWNEILNDIKNIESIVVNEISMCKTKLKQNNLNTQHTNIHYELSNVIGYLSKLQETMYNIRKIGTGDFSTLSNKPYLLIEGNAGVGKTHLLCDLAKVRSSKGLPTILTLAKKLEQGNPWLKIIENLGLNISIEQFLGALNSAAELVNSRAIIIIDALNETDNKTIWKNNIRGMMELLNDYPQIGLILSVRSEFKDMIIPDKLIPEKMICIQHNGFDNVYNAIRNYFKHYKIPDNEVPILLPEFYNPQFLNLYCKSYKNNKLPNGDKISIVNIYDNFLNYIDDKLASPEKLDYDVNDKCVHKAVFDLAKEMYYTQKNSISRDKAKTIISNILPNKNYSESLFKYMLDEDVIFETRMNNNELTYIEFTYEQFADYMIATWLINNHVDLKNIEKTFLKIPNLNNIINNDNNLGLLKALLVIFSEKHNKEIFDLLPTMNEDNMVELFLDGLLFRTSRSITNDTIKFMNTRIDNDKYFQQFYDSLILSALKTNHPFNANYIHEKLHEQNLSNRDSKWSIHISQQFAEFSPVTIMLKFIVGNENLNIETLKLCGVLLSWFLSSPKRSLRDKATKIMVMLFYKQIPTLIEILKKFINVDDPYILERLIAIAYGCVTKSNDDKSIGQLANYIYDAIFKNNPVTPHILLRDYARGIIEFAIHKNIKMVIEYEKICPPYNSNWVRIPTENEISSYRFNRSDVSDNTYNNSDSSSEPISAKYRIESSLFDGDFARYALRLNFGNGFAWSSAKLPNDKIPRETKYRKFKSSLPDAVKNDFNKFIENLDLIRNDIKDNSNKRKLIPIELPREEINEFIAKICINFSNLLNREQRDIFNKDIIPYVRYLINIYPNDNFVSGIQRWMLKRIYELGWTVKKFGQYDVMSSIDYSRMSHTSERMGKKYQWLAYHEILSRLSDNYEFRGDELTNKLSIYSGPWQQNYRDIDPTSLVVNSNLDTSKTPTWYYKHYDAWNSIENNDDWLHTMDDFIPFTDLVLAKSSDNIEWFILHANYIYTTHRTTQGVKYSTLRDVWCFPRCYLVKNKNITSMQKWGAKQNFWDHWMPEPSLYNVYLREHPWSLSFKYESDPYFADRGWFRYLNKKMPDESCATFDTYKNDNEYDNSIDSPINLMIPSKEIIEGMKLKRFDDEKYYNENGELVAYDPTNIDSSDHSILLINKKLFLDYLEKNNLTAFWIVTGEKLLVPIGHSKFSNGSMMVNGILTLDDSNNLCDHIKSKFIPHPFKN